MTRLDIFYNVLIGLLKNIADSRATDSFYTSLPPSEKAKFMTLVDPIKDFLIELRRTRRRTEIFSDFDLLSIELEKFFHEYSNFPNLRAEQIRKALLICKRVAPFVNNFRVGTSELVIIGLDQRTKPYNYLFHGGKLSNSALIFSINDTSAEDKQDFLNFITNVPDQQIQILFCLLNHMSSRRPLNKNQYILANRTNEKKSHKIISLLKLCSICEGNVIHSPYEVCRVPQIVDKNISLRNSYSQFIDPIYVLSEYNYEKDILNKYLKLYHVVESFMFKIPIVDLMTLTSGKMFSVRNFKTLYSKIDKQEIAALKDFLKVVFDIDRNIISKFDIHIRNTWISLSGIVGFNLANVDGFLKLLNIPYNYVSASAAGSFLDFYCRLIYLIRNSIVHNKETEYHILHSSLNPVVPFLLNNFLFPTLEEVCFKLIIDINSNVKYTQNSLQLFEE
jgi:hypothetical protein